MSCMYFHGRDRHPDDSTESSDSITYWRKLLDFPSNIAGCRPRANGSRSTAVNAVSSSGRWNAVGRAATLAVLASTRAAPAAEASATGESPTPFVCSVEFRNRPRGDGVQG